MKIKLQYTSKSFQDAIVTNLYRTIPLTNAVGNTNIKITAKCLLNGAVLGVAVAVKHSCGELVSYPPPSIVIVTVGVQKPGHTMVKTTKLTPS